MGSVAPISCGVLASCPMGSDSMPKFGATIFIFVAFVVLLIGFQIKKYINQRINLQYLEQLDKIKSESDINEAIEELTTDDTATIGSIETAIDGNSSPQGGENNLKSNEARRFDICFKDLSLTLPTGVTVMRGVTGELKAGRTCAIMGPSGAGKTTFVNLLTGKAKRTTGTIHINGIEQELSHFRKLIGMVPQEDIMLRELTVRDILMHSAFMRLPRNWPRKEKENAVLSTINFLGLSHVQDSIIGDEENRGISGGQRKRVNIGMELVASPSVLLLDEPTSGLDSATGYEVCALLRKIARQQFMTVAAVIHSPSQQAFEMFDDLLLLGKGGRIIYSGPRADAEAYFYRLGFSRPDNFNPADYFMDIASGKMTHEVQYVPAHLFYCWQYHVEGKDPTRVFTSASPRTPNTPKLKSPNKKRSIKAYIGYIRDGILGHIRDTRAYFKDVYCEFRDWIVSMYSKDPIRETAGFWEVFGLCYKRASLQLYRSPSNFLFDQIVHILCGVFISSAASSNDYYGSLPKQVCDYTTVILKPLCEHPLDLVTTTAVFLMMGSMFGGIITGASTFVYEKVVFWRDSAAGMPTLPYFLAKFIADIPRLLIAAVMFTLTTILFQTIRMPLGYYFVLIFQMYFGTFAMGYFLAAVLDKSKVSLAAIAFMLIWATLFSGAAPPLSVMRMSPAWPYFGWVFSLSITRWFGEAFYIREMMARPWEELHDPEKPLSHGYEKGNLIPSHINLFVISCAWGLLGLACMKLMNRSRTK